MTPSLDTLYHENQEKVCAKCGSLKPLADFIKRKRNRDGRGTICKACRRKAKPPKVKPTPPEFKICAKLTCIHDGAPQPSANFHKINPRYKYKDNLDSQCKSCRSSYGKEMNAKLKMREISSTETFRVCSKCGGKPQPIENFSPNPANRGGISAACKACMKKKHQEWVTKNRDYHLGKTKKNYQDNKDKYREQAKDKKLRNFGVDKNWYEETIASQNGGCAICGGSDPLGFGGRFAIDHNHDCCPPQKGCEKCRRGLLCFPCNARLSHIESDWIFKAIAYLRKYGSSIDIYGCPPNPPDSANGFTGS